MLRIDRQGPILDLEHFPITLRRILRRRDSFDIRLL